MLEDAKDIENFCHDLCYVISVFNTSVLLLFPFGDMPTAEER